MIIPPKSLLRPVGRAIGDYRMIRASDRILVAVSGGKDSLSLLHLLLHLEPHAPIRFSLGAATVDPQIPGFEPALLQAPLGKLGIRYHFISQPIFANAEGRLRGNSFCAWCARMKRGVLYTTARKHGYNVLALGQHLDDLAESLFMSMFHGGRLQTMKAHYRNDAGDIRVIRPLAYVRERQCAAFAEAAGLPVIPDNCPACYRAPTQRAYMKALIAREEKAHPALVKNLLHAMRPLLTDDHGAYDSTPFGASIERD